MKIDISAIENYWETEILPTLSEYVSIPCLSVHFEPEWRQTGHIHRAVELVRAWVERQGLQGAQIEVIELEGRTPVLLVEIEAFSPTGSPSQTPPVLMYGHLDKQPPFEGWREGLHPWKAVREGEKLYGRGTGDDGYAVFMATAIIKHLQQQGVAHSRVVMLLETSEESGSPDLEAYVNHLADRIGTPGLVLALDSGCGDYERLWLTTSLRGNLIARLRVQVMSEGVHSGISGGAVPNPLRLARQLLERVENGATGAIRLPELNADIPLDRVEQARQAAEVLWAHMAQSYPTLPGVQLEQTDAEGLLLATTWQPNLAIIGQKGLPPAETAGNVLLPEVDLKLSFRLPPTVKAPVAAQAVKSALEANPPQGAKVSVTAGGETGWNAQPLPQWLDTALEEGSQLAYGQSFLQTGLGGSIPFMGLLESRFPEAVFVITGVLGPHSNAHGPNEFLHVDYAKRLTAAMSHVLMAQAKV